MDSGLNREYAQGIVMGSVNYPYPEPVAGCARRSE